MSCDTLFLLKREFPDPNLSNDTYFCPHTARIEGLLATFPEKAQNLDVIRVDFARPRAAVVARIGTENQSLPVLVLADDAAPDLPAKSAGNERFIAEQADILETLARRHGFPRPHP